MKPHKWAKEIKAWADGGEIECRYGELDAWEQCCPPSWRTEDGFEYRIKPKTRKAIIDGVEYVLPEALPHDVSLRCAFFVDSLSCIHECFESMATVPGRCYETREDAELFAKADKALKGVL